MDVTHTHKCTHTCKPCPDLVAIPPTREKKAPLKHLKQTDSNTRVKRGGSRLDKRRMRGDGLISQKQEILFTQPYSPLPSVGDIILKHLSWCVCGGVCFTGSNACEMKGSPKCNLSTITQRVEQGCVCVHIMSDQTKLRACRQADTWVCSNRKHLGGDTDQDVCFLALPLLSPSLSLPFFSLSWLHIFSFCTSK